MKKATKKGKVLLNHTSSLSKAHLLIFALVFACIGGYVIYRSFASTIYYIAPNGSDNNACTQSSPCQSMNRAYQLASPGDTVQMAGGDYTSVGYQSLDYKASMRNLSPGCDPLGQWGSASTTNCISFVPAPGANLTLGGISVSGSGVYIAGSANSNLATRSRTYNIKNLGESYVVTNDASQLIDHVTITGINTNAFSAYDADYVLYKNIASGGVTITSNCNGIDNATGRMAAGLDESKIGDRVGHIPTNIVLDSVYFFDTWRDDAGANNGGAVGPCHRGALFMINANGVTIQNSAWSRNWVYDIQVQNFNGDQFPTNVTVQNNWFGCGDEAGTVTSNPAGENQCNGQAAIQFDNTPTNWLVRYNSTGPGTSLYGCYAGPCTYNGLKVLGNVGERQGACDGSGVTYGYNAWTQGPCTASDVAWNGSFTNINVGSEDFHLSNGTNNAIGLVTPTTSDYSLATDIDGGTRTVPRDAGADEYGVGASPTPSVTISASPSTIGTGGSSTLTWFSANVTSCTGSGAWSGSKATSGSQSVSPSSTSTYTLTCTGSNGSANNSATVTVSSDTTPPTVSVTAPANNATVSATTSVTANASDNVAVAGVQFKLDGSNLGAEDTASPYSYSWDTTTASNGSHTITAVARDSSNNTTTSTTVNVTVSNSGGGSMTITSVSPAFGPIGSRVTINGTNLNQATIVEFNQGGVVNFTINSSTKITATIPSGSQNGYISINQGGALSPQPFTITRQGDLNNDTKVNIFDLSILLSNYTTSNMTADINGDGTVNITDLSILLTNYGT